MFCLRFYSRSFFSHFFDSLFSNCFCQACCFCVYWKIPISLVEANKIMFNWLLRNFPKRLIERSLKSLFSGYFEKVFDLDPCLWKHFPSLFICLTNNFFLLISLSPLVHPTALCEHFSTVICLSIPQNTFIFHPLFLTWNEMRKKNEKSNLLQIKNVLYRRKAKDGCTYYYICGENAKKRTKRKKI